MTSKIHSNCICGNTEPYEKCCEPYLLGNAVPLTAEALMRSRYTAYVQANIAYIQDTMREKAAEGFDPVQAEHWTKSVKWKRLKVLRTFPDETDENVYYVEFIAFYNVRGREHHLSELSKFKRVEGKWYYTGF